MREFIRADRRQYHLLPPSIEEWLPENHLAGFVVETCDQFDLSEIYSQYGTSGSPPYDPRMLVGLLFYGYCTGVLSSRKIEMATYDSVAFRFISGDHHPDHDTVATFRQRFLPELEGLFCSDSADCAHDGFCQGGQSKHRWDQSWGQGLETQCDEL